MLPSFFSTFLSEHNICSSLTNKPRVEHGRIGVKLSHSRRQSLFFRFPLFIHTPPPIYNSFEILTTTSSWSMSDSAFNTNARNFILPFCFSRSSLVNPVFKKNIFSSPYNQIQKSCCVWCCDVEEIFDALAAEKQEFYFAAYTQMLSILSVQILIWRSYSFTAT